MALVLIRKPQQEVSQPVKEDTVSKKSKTVKKTVTRGAPSKVAISKAKNQVKRFTKLLADRTKIRDKSVAWAKTKLLASTERLKGLEKRAAK
jgi:hypothetical protein